MNYEWYIHTDRTNITIHYNFAVFATLYGIEIEDSSLLRWKASKEAVGFFAFGNKKKYNVFQRAENSALCTLISLGIYAGGC